MFCLFSLGWRKVAFILGMFAFASQAAVPVIFDTDIGSDIDDTWALSLILKSPELDLKLVTTATEEPVYRAKVAAKFLELAGRSDVPVGIGIASEGSAEFQKPWVEGYQLADYPGEIAEDGVGKLIDVVRSSAETVTIIVAGPMHNIQAALERAPDIAGKVKLVGMHGSIDKGYDDAPSAEYNVQNNVPAFRAALQAPWQGFTITPLDTCGDIVIEGPLFARLKASEDAQLQAIFTNFEIWADLVTFTKVDYTDRHTSILYDSVAVYLALPEHPLLPTETMAISVDDEGFTRRDPAGSVIQVAMQWQDKAGFYEWMTERLLSQPH
ncbi:nucleoside hydrolase [Alteromonas aestuariivivens]|uniref:Nucleoside hydrolase n=1 Tax=Alteromonas aestuariivivens TaxID=1938339 RepID=A0A3D8MAQ7_9ALTE|nr:nucleoside hydrolase [Alteromonas aestuariivivens]RDV26815.1 nucleoside hydrolase [Alteromonas aestuariivivens]